MTLLVNKKEIEMYNALQVGEYLQCVFAYIRTLLNKFRCSILQKNINT